MDTFDQLENIWGSQQPSANKKTPDYKKLRSRKTKILCEQRNGAIMLICTAVLIAVLAFTIHFAHWYTYLALVLVILICLLQATLMVQHYRKCAAIDESLPPREHLQQWENYQVFLLKQLRWNMPVYYILLNLAMGLYFIEIFAGRPVLNTILFLGIYLAWMLFAYFYLGRKKKKQAINRIELIITDLQKLEAQFS